MKSRRERSIIVFAELGFLTLTVFMSGYLFVDLKNKESRKETENKPVVMEKDIEFPNLNNEGSKDYITNANSQETLEMRIPRKGGTFIIGNKTFLRKDLRAALEGIKGRSVNLMVDKMAPSEDTLYFFSIIGEYNLLINVLHNISEEERL